MLSEEMGDRLEVLNLYACRLITSAGIRRHVPTLARLESVNLRGTNMERADTEELVASTSAEVLTGKLIADSIYS